MIESGSVTLVKCYHCGTETEQGLFEHDNKTFCCAGCAGVYRVLSASDMCSYYSYNENPGKTAAQKNAHLEFLDEPVIVKDLVDYTDESVSSISLYIPAIHCSSCIWLLESLYRFNPGIIHSRIDFLKKQLSVTFRHQEISLRQVVELLHSIGYEPLLSLQDVVKEKKHSVNRDLIRKIAVAGFCTGNVMLLSFPEYFGLEASAQQFRALFGWLNLAFTIPVFFYCSRDFFVSALGGLRHRMINLDAPLALIILVLFLRTAYEVISGTGSGFSDTLTGLVFLLLTGRWVRQRSYNHVAFERDYRSYFPVAVTTLTHGVEKPAPVNDIKVGDRLLIRNNEVIPADGILMKGEALIDFSFVTGESAPVPKILGEIIYAGGRQEGEAIELEVVKPVSASYLASLWNNETFHQTDDEGFKTFNDQLAKYFSIVTFIIAFAATGYWLASNDTHRAWQSFTAVLIVACPCVLALSSPFTLTLALKLFDRLGFYLKNTDAVEKLARVDTIVFDKTGTLTTGANCTVTVSRTPDEQEKIWIASLLRNSGHPLSREILKSLNERRYLPIVNFKEIPGKGLEGYCEGNFLRAGSNAFISGAPEGSGASAVHLEIDGIYWGSFSVKQGWRNNLHSLFNALKWKFDLHVLSGDQDGDKQVMMGFFPFPHKMFFGRSPHDKLAHIRDLQLEKKNVAMLGDGLNDAGALRQSNIGIAVSDDINNFNPACDAVIKGGSLALLPNFIRHSKDGVLTIRLSFIISASYNLVGIWFAVQGELSPLIAAVLMPLSTLTILGFTSLLSRIFSRKNQLR